MSTISDIPERENQDGETQLLYLRSYLKDREIGNYIYPDSLLIDLLVSDSKEIVWEELTGYLNEKPWGYNTSLPMSYESRIRALTGDTNEEELVYTDYDLKIFMETIPLRYVVILINAEMSNESTYPLDDINNPIYIIRKYLKDIDITIPKYTDADITKMLFKSRQDPFAFVSESLSRSAGASVGEAVVDGGGSLASIDGISFNDDITRTDNLVNNLEYINRQAVNSVYYKYPVYGFWMEGENLVDINWERDWYGV